MSRFRAASAVLVLVVLLAGCTSGVGPAVAEEKKAGTNPIVETASNPTGTIEVHAIDVGQADATLVVGPSNETMLIDSGDWRNDGETVLRYLDERGVERIDYLVTTHAHADHIGGHEAVIDHYETEADGIGAIYDPGVAATSATYERYLDAVERHDVTLFRALEGDEIPMDGADVTVFNPPADAESDDLHYNSLAVRVAFGNVSFLFTGDAEADAERRMVDAHGEGLSATVLQAGHHGSDTSSAGPFLDAVDPAVAIVSSSYDSQYGHPHEETLDRFAERSIATVWTAIHGTIVFTSDGDVVRVEVQADRTLDPDRLRTADPVEADPVAPAEERIVIANVTVSTTAAAETAARARTA